MNMWATFWAGLILVSMACFAILAAFVTISGYRDVLAMFRRIEDQHEESEQEGREG